MGVLRVHPDGGHHERRSPYAWSCTVARAATTALLLGACKAPTRAVVRAVDAALVDAGFARRSYERATAGRPARTVAKPLQPEAPAPMHRHAAKVHADLLAALPDHGIPDHPELAGDLAAHLASRPISRLFDLAEMGTPSAQAEGGYRLTMALLTVRALCLHFDPSGRDPAVSRVVRGLNYALTGKLA